MKVFVLPALHPPQPPTVPPPFLLFIQIIWMPVRSRASFGVISEALIERNSIVWVG